MNQLKKLLSISIGFLPVLVIATLLLVSCQEEEEPSAPRTWDCAGDEREDLIGTWWMHSYGASAVEGLNCHDTLCPEFNLRLYEDGSYSMDYFMYSPYSDNPTFYARQDTGVFEFECLFKNSYRTRMSYERTNGILSFSPQGKEPYAWEFTYDFFWKMLVDVEIGGDQGYSHRLGLAQ